MHALHILQQRLREAGELALDIGQGGAQAQRKEILDALLAAVRGQRLGPVTQDMRFVSGPRTGCAEALLHILDSHESGGVSPARIKRTAGSGSSIMRAMTRCR